MARVIQVNAEAFSDDNDPIPAGTVLRASVYDVIEGKSGPNSKNPGSPQFNYTAKVEEDGPYKGREIRYNYVPLDGTVAHAFQLTNFADAVGWPSSRENGVEVPDDLRDVLGTEVMVKVEVTQEGYNRVRRISPVKEGGKQAPPQEKPEWSKL